MALVHDAPAGVSVCDVDGEAECLGPQTVLGVDLDEEVDEVRAHVPREFGLLIDEFDRRACQVLGKITRRNDKKKKDQI